MGITSQRTFSGTGYWALILGGSSGIGLATAHKLAAEGMNICIVYRDRRAAARALQGELARMSELGVEAIGLNMDGLKEENIATALAQLTEKMKADDKIRLLLHSISRGSLKVMVTMPDSPDENAAPDSVFSEIQASMKERFTQKQPTLSRSDYQLTMEAMALSLYDWVKATFDRGLFAGDARVLGLTSEGNQKAWRNYAAVSAAKAALEAISRSIALEFAPYGIRSNILQPGVTNTASLRMIPGQEILRAQAAFRNPFGRLTRPEDVANAVYLMCRDEAAWINGAIIPVDGGEKNS